MSRGSGLSVVIPTYNCAPVLNRCLKSVGWADEIIVVDMWSTDETIDVARKYNANIYRRIPEHDNFDLNRKFGMLKATKGWVLKLDSDEVLSSDLQQEIKEVIAGEGDASIDGYFISNKIYMFGREVKHGFVKPGSNEMRLFKNDKWKYSPSRYHQQISVDGRTGFLKSFYLHYNYRTVFEFVAKMNRYTSLDAVVVSRGLSVSSIQVFLAPLKTFLKLYIFQVGLVDGLLGVEVCLLYSIYNLTEKVKVWESNNT